MAPLEDFLTDLTSCAEPKRTARSRIQKKIAMRIADSSVLEGVRQELTPKKSAQQRVWKRVARMLEDPAVSTIERLKEQLTPSEEIWQQLHLRTFFQQRLVSTEPSKQGIAVKWLAAFAVFAILVRMSPLLFVASPTHAEAEIFLLPTRGEVYYSTIERSWRSVRGRVALEPGMLLKTGESETSIVLRDDGVLRLDENTTVRLDTLALNDVHITLFQGKVWLQGLVPSRLPGMTVATSYGDIVVHEGSVSIAEDSTVDVVVYDRRASVIHEGNEVFLTAGERTSLWDGNVMLVKKVPAKWYQRDWARQNLARDAVHRQDIAQLQQERLVAQAGILPTSPLYPVKRIAEAVDVIFTFDGEKRVQKKVQLAGTRLNEAAALLAEGETVDAVLDDYREAVAELGDEGLAQFLVSRAVHNLAGDVAAALPGDEGYILKKTVLEASRDLPDAIVRNEVVEGELLLDNLAVLTSALDSGDARAVQTLWTNLQPYLAVIESEELVLNPGLHKEAQALLGYIATAVHESYARGTDIDPELLDDLAVYLPPEQHQVEVASLSEEEVMAIVQRIRKKIFVYDMQKSRINQFIAELRALEGHPDLGRILRRLAIALPDGPENFPERVFKEIVRLRWQKVAEDVV